MRTAANVRQRPRRTVASHDRASSIPKDAPMKCSTSRLARWGACAVLALAAQLPAPAQLQASATDARAGEHDFDFEIGTWKTHIKRLQHPLSGSSSWVEYEGTSVVRKIWGGRANLVELQVAGPAGHIEGLSLRLYNPVSHQWSLNFSNSASGTLGPPTIGEFKNGRGEFYDEEPFNGRTILVRFAFSIDAPNSTRDEQSFSDDGGKTWELNWINTATRTGH
jgi:hypothetical protein